MAWQLFTEHPRVQFIGLAVEIDITARHQGAQHGCSCVKTSQEQFVDQNIFRSAKLACRELACLKQMPWDFRAAMWRIEDQRCRPLRWRQNFKAGGFSLRHVLRVAPWFCNRIYGTGSGRMSIVLDIGVQRAFTLGGLMK